MKRLLMDELVKWKNKVNRLPLITCVILLILPSTLVACTSTITGGKPEIGTKPDTNTFPEQTTQAIEESLSSATYEADAAEGGTKIQDYYNTYELWQLGNPRWHTDEPFTAYSFNGHMSLGHETEEFFFGTWRVERLLGFANSYNDASEYPDGQKIIGNIIEIEKERFSSMGLENYNVYQRIRTNPIYEINSIFYDSTEFYRSFKVDLPTFICFREMMYISVYSSIGERYTPMTWTPLSLFIIDNDILILSIEAAYFQLERV
jgi:hypothetical protein